MPVPKREFDDHEKDVYSTLTQHMGNPLDEFDMGVASEIERLVHEGNPLEPPLAPRAKQNGTLTL
jgi:hypothetical protein